MRQWTCPLCNASHDVQDTFFSTAMNCPSCGKSAGKDEKEDSFWKTFETDRTVIVKESSKKESVPSAYLPIPDSSDLKASKDKALEHTAIEMHVPETFSRYCILSEIGSGGMGKVYKARDPQLDRIVALKVILSAQSDIEGAVERFSREARAMARLKHPNIVAVYDIGNQGGHFFFTMDYVEGHSLKEKIVKGSLSVGEAVNLMIKIAQAVDYAHRQGVIHRDLKPSNILIDEEGEPKILDFGLAKLSKDQEQLSKSGMILGTLQYMPPEQADGAIHEIDERSDVYALGAILYEMVAKTPPFQGETSFNLITQILSKKPESIAQYNPDVSKPLEKICLKALEKKKEKRYSSVREMVDELKAVLAPRPAKKKAPRMNLAKIEAIFKPKVMAAGVILLASFALFFFWPFPGYRAGLPLPPPDGWPVALWNTVWMEKEKCVDFSDPQWEKLTHSEQYNHARAYQIWYAQKHKTDIQKEVLVAGVPFEMALIPPGRFWMGSPETEESRNPEETRHRVLISRPFWIGRYEVTQAQWKASEMKNPSKSVGSTLPVDYVSWKDCREFCEKMKMDMPTEAQWEYACRAGTLAPFNLGKDVAEGTINWKGHSRGSMKGGTLPDENAWGCFDMHGNVMEWCKDMHERYPEGPVTDPQGMNQDSRQVYRGGYFSAYPEHSRSAKRHSIGAGYQGRNLGFRIAIPWE